MVISNQLKEQNFLYSGPYITSTKPAKTKVVQANNLPQDLFLYEYTIKVLAALAAYLFAMVFVADKWL